MIKYILLGIVQGLTEFFPVSSSAHLVITQRVLGIQGKEVALSVVLHLGTLCALAVFFFKDILALLRNVRSIILILIITFITGIIGVARKSFFEALFSNIRVVGIALIFTAVILFFASRAMNGKRNIINIKDALILGLTQGIAIIPGISRSGMTISTLLFRGVEKQEAFRFSFLASMPVILGAALLEAKKIGFCLLRQGEFAHFAAGFMSSFCIGLLALWLLKRIIARAKLHYFAYYCVVLSLITLIFIR